MKKFALVLSAIMVFAVSGFAQDASVADLKNPEVDAPQNGRRILVSRFYENWEISARIGTQAYLGEYTPNFLFKFKDWWNFPAIDFGIHKWATNSLGVSLEATFSPYKGIYMLPGATWKGDDYAQFAKEGDPIYIDGQGKGSSWALAKGSMGNVYLSALINLSNLIGGYKASRFYTLVASVGGGIMFPTVPVQYKEICASFNAGLNNKFRIASHLTLDVDIRGTLHDDMFNGISYYTSDDRPNLSVDATIGATIGLSYRFNWKKETNSKGKRVNKEGWTTVNDVVKETPDYLRLKSEADAAAVAVATSTAALAAAQNKVSEQEKVIKEQDAIIKEAAEAEFSYKQFINFVVDRWELSNREKVAIMLASEVMKEHPDVKFLISGFADKQTSNPEHNKMLSENRAEAVFNCLVNEFGINPDQLRKADFGGVDYMYFDDKQCSRSVLITVDNK